MRFIFFVLAFLSSSAFADYKVTAVSIGMNGISTDCGNALKSATLGLVGSFYLTKLDMDSGLVAGSPASLTCGTLTITRDTHGETSGSKWRIMYKYNSASQIELLFSFLGVDPCPPGTERNSLGNCEAPDPCKGRDSKEPDFLWVSFNKGQSPYGTKCKDGCQVAQTGPVSHPTKNPDGETYTGGTADFHQLMKIQYFAVKCDAVNGPSSPGDQPQPNVPPKPKGPKCLAGEGVLTSSSGAVSCVPEGVFGAKEPVEKDTLTKDDKGNVIKKNSTTDPVTGATTTTTTSTDANGNTSSTSTSSGAGGTGDNSGDEPGECAKEPDAPMCKKGQIKDKGKYGDGQDAKLAEAKAQLSAKFSEIRSALSNQFGGGSGGSSSGSLPCPAPMTVLGATISFCVADYAESLSVIGAIIVFAATIIAAIMVVSA